MNDFTRTLIMLTSANAKFHIDVVEGEHPGICVPSEYPEEYSTGVYFSFNEDGSLFAVHSYEPDEAEE